MISRVFLLTHLLVFLLLQVNYTHGTYTVTADQYYNLPIVYGSSYTTFNSSVYNYGGKTINSDGITFNSGDLYQISIPNPTSYGSDVSYKLLSSFGNASYGQMVYLPQSQSLLMIGGVLPALSPNVTTSPPLVMTMYHLQNSSWSPAPIALNSPVPINRQRFGAALSTVNNLVYIYGGLDSYYGLYFLNDFWSYDPVTGIFNNLTSTLSFPAGESSSLVSLSNGNLMVMFGLQQLINGIGYTVSASRIPTFNVRTNQWSTTITQNPGYERCAATTMLSPNESSIVAFGGNNCAGIAYQGFFNHTHILDLSTNTWQQQQQQQQNKITPRARAWAFGGFLDSNHILVSGGNLNTQAFNDINVLGFPMEPGQSPQWIKTYYQSLYTDESSGIDGGRIAGIVIGVLLGAILLGLFIWKFGRYFRYLILNLHYDIWRPRSGEPLWTETCRVISQVILFFLFLIFVVYIGLQVRDSPTNVLTVNEDVSSVTTPNIRICIEGYHDPAQPDTPIIQCILDDGTNCNYAMRPLDPFIEKPVYIPSFGSVQCHYYHANSNITIGPSLETPTNTGTKMLFTVYGNGSIPGAIHVDTFAPGWDPIESIFYNFTTYMSPVDISNWRNSDHNNLLVDNSYALLTGGTMTINYQIETYKRLTDSSWNYIGIAPQFDTITRLNTQQRTTLISPPSAFNQPIGTIYFIPQAMVNKTLREAKLFSVISALSYAGGLFSLFLTVQTLLFGYRPSSPFGVVHRWSVGDMKRSISDGLVSRFSSLRTPVPLVNPVHRRFSKLDIKSYGNTNQGPLHSGDYDPTLVDGLDSMEKGTTLENEPLTPVQDEEGNRLARMEVMEERLQLMELLFKSYYINDEVFQSLDKALKKDKIRKRSSMTTFTDSPSMEAEATIANITQTTLVTSIMPGGNSNDNSDTSDNEHKRIIKARRKSWLPAFKTSGGMPPWDLGASSTATPVLPPLANPTRDFIPTTPSPIIPRHDDPHVYSEAPSYLNCPEHPSSSSHQPQYLEQQDQQHEHHCPK